MRSSFIIWRCVGQASSKKLTAFAACISAYIKMPYSLRSQSDDVIKGANSLLHLRGFNNVSPVANTVSVKAITNKSQSSTVANRVKSQPRFPRVNYAGMDQEMAE